MSSSEKPKLRTDMDFAYGVPKLMAPGVVRLVANNPGPFTFKGTNTYIVGETALMVIDPGPADHVHLQAILDYARGRPISHVLITHTHRDHIDGLAALVRATGAKTAGFGRAGMVQDEAIGSPTGKAMIDSTFAPQVPLRDGDALEGAGFALTAVHTPGHAPDHLCFALTLQQPGPRVLFSADHVMAWSTSVVAPPEGHMGDYLASLEKLVPRDDEVYLPGHGGRLLEPQKTVRAFLVHRRWREDAILSFIRDGAKSNQPTTMAKIVARVYADLNPSLLAAAGLSVEAHVRHLVDRGLVRFEPPLTQSQVLFPA